MSIILTLASSAKSQEWTVSPPRFAANTPDLDSRVSFDPASGSIKLANRGCIVSEKEFPNGAKIGFTWKWTEGKAEGAYQDVLTIALESDGSLRETRPFEVSNGIVILLQAHAGAVTIQSRTAAEEKGLEEKKSFVFEKDKDYSVVIVLKESRVTVTLDGKEAATATVPPDFVAVRHRIAIYNREPVAGVRKVSVLRNLKAE